MNSGKTRKTVNSSSDVINNRIIKSGAIWAIYGQSSVLATDGRGRSVNYARVITTRRVNNYALLDMKSLISAALLYTCGVISSKIIKTATHPTSSSSAFPLLKVVSRS